MYETIVVPTDGSGSANRAVDAAISLGKRVDAEVHAIYAVDVQEVPGSISVDPEDLFAEAGNRALSSAEEAATSRDSEVTTARVRASESIPDAIIGYAKEHEADVIVMGSRGRTGLDRFVMGSVTERTLRKSPIPVLTVKEAGAKEDVERILVPTDGSEGALEAADHAIRLASDTGATLHVLNVVDVTSFGGELATGPMYEEFERLGRESVDDIIERAEDAGIDRVEADVASGRAARAIVDYADERNIDIVVIGTHGRSGLDRWLLGSVAEKVVRIAPTPVLTVNVRAMREG